MNKTIPAQAVLAFLDALAEGQVNLHGFLMLRGGETVAEGYWKPYEKDMPHRMFSVSKSITALAVGILVKEGRLSLDDPIAAFFPEYLPAPLPGPIARMTIRHMLRMATAHRLTTYKRVQDDNWARTFFTVPPTNEPGAVFSYDTSSSHTLAALVQKLTGQSLLDFLRERLFTPLGCTGEMRWLTDPVGVCQGGSGLMMTLPDLGRVAALCMRGGGSLVPEAFLREATARQIDTPLQPHLEERFGYGYQFWRTRHNGYAMYGMGGQLAVCLPDFDLCLCTVGDTLMDASGVQKIYDALFAHVLPRLNDREEPDARQGLEKRLAALSLPVVGHREEHACWNGETFRFDPNELGIKEAVIQKDALRYVNASGEHFLYYGLGELKKGLFPGTEAACYASAGWTGPGVFQILCHVLDDEPGVMAMTLAYADGRLTVQARGTPTEHVKDYTGVASGESGR